MGKGKEKCSVCGKVFGTINELLAHENDFHRSIKKEPGPLVLKIPKMEKSPPSRSGLVLFLIIVIGTGFFTFSFFYNGLGNVITSAFDVVATLVDSTDIFLVEQEAENISALSVDGKSGTSNALNASVEEYFIINAPLIINDVLNVNSDAFFQALSVSNLSSSSGIHVSDDGFLYFEEGVFVIKNEDGDGASLGIGRDYLTSDRPFLVDVLDSFSDLRVGGTYAKEIFIGGENVDTNLEGDVFINDRKVCLSDGSNCPVLTSVIETSERLAYPVMFSSSILNTLSDEEVYLPLGMSVNFQLNPRFASVLVDKNFVINSVSWDFKSSSVNEGMQIFLMKSMGNDVFEPVMSGIDFNSSKGFFSGFSAEFMRGDLMTLKYVPSSSDNSIRELLVTLEGYYFEGVLESQNSKCDFSRDCGVWGGCISDYKTRNCVNTYESCETETFVEKQDCLVTCDEYVTCEAWSDCASSVQSRECVRNEVNCTSVVFDEEQSCECVEKSKCKWDHCYTYTNGSIVSAYICNTTETDCSTYEVIEKSKAANCVNELSSANESAQEGNNSSQEQASVNVSINIVEEDNNTSEGENNSKKPDELFDITFNINENVLESSNELISTVILESFGFKSTKTRLTYVIKDEEGLEFYSVVDELVVETEKLIIRHFEDLNLDKGDYVIHLTLEYSDVVDSFFHNFSVGKSVFTRFLEWFLNFF